MRLYQTMVFECEMYRVRTAAGYISDYLSEIVFYLNKTYFKDWRNGHITELKKLKYLPHNFIEYYAVIIKAKTIDELKTLSYLLIDVTRKFISISGVQNLVPDYFMQSEMEKYEKSIMKVLQ